MFDSEAVLNEVKKLVPEAIGAELRTLLAAGETAKTTVVSLTAQLDAANVKLKDITKREVFVDDRAREIGNREVDVRKREDQLVVAEKAAVASAAKGDASFELVKLLFNNNTVRKTIIGNASVPNNMGGSTYCTDNKTEERVG